MLTRFERGAETVIKPYRLFAARGGGSMIVEAAFGFTKLRLRIQNVEWSDLGWESRTLKEINPLGQVPTLVMPDGTVMTESAAMILHLADRAKAFPLVPAATSPQRAAFLRWLVFLNAAVYPTFTYGDVPERWVGAPKEKGAGKALRTSTDEHRKVLLRFLETQAKGPYFLGKTMTALDLYLWILATWRPGKEWLAANCPKLAAIAATAGEHPVCRKVMRRNGY